MIRRHAAALHVDLARLARVHGGLGIHSVRSLYGRYWGHYRGMLSEAADMLHHGDIEITKKRYIGRNPSEIALEVTASGGADAMEELRRELDALRLDNARLRGESGEAA